MPETPLDIARTWAEFTDPANPEQRYRVDLTFLTSSWTCIFGSGCHGIYADRPDDGCCTLGAHFTDDDDVTRVQAVVAELGEDEWQHHPGYGKRGDKDPSRLSAWTDVEDGSRTTRVVDGACILLNRPGFPAGAGCALHQHAVLTGRPPHEAKPDVCWQLPIRRSYRTVELPDDTSYLEITIAEYDRRGWGPGGHDLDWYCSGSTEAHVGREPVYRGSRDELVALMGEGAYEALVVRCEAHLSTVRRARSAGARQLIPLLVHPATIEAGTIGGRRGRAPRRKPGANEPAHPVGGSGRGAPTGRTAAARAAGATTPATGSGGGTTRTSDTATSGTSGRTEPAGAASTGSPATGKSGKKTKTADTTTDAPASSKSEKKTKTADTTTDAPASSKSEKKTKTADTTTDAPATGKSGKRTKTGAAPTGKSRGGKSAGGSAGGKGRAKRRSAGS